MAAEAHNEVQGFIEALSHLYGELRAGLAEISPAALYTQPASGGWTLMEDLAHVAEMLGYWSGEIDRFVRQPGGSFGRVASNPERIRFIESHAHDSLEQITVLLDQGQAAALSLLRRLQPADLETSGQHVKFGEQTARHSGVAHRSFGCTRSAAKRDCIRGCPVAYPGTFQPLARSDIIGEISSSLRASVVR